MPLCARASQSNREVDKTSMKNGVKKRVIVLGTLLCAFVITTVNCELRAQSSGSSAAVTSSSLVGVWTLTAADNLQPDGSRVHSYGPSPQGILIFGADGRYTVEIFRADRMKFSAGDNLHGTLEEYKGVSLGMSCHFGRYRVDTEKGTITFQIERASFPNWDGTTQTRPFTLTGDELS